MRNRVVRATLTISAATEKQKGQARDARRGCVCVCVGGVYLAGGFEVLVERAFAFLALDLSLK